METGRDCREDSGSAVLGTVDAPAEPIPANSAAANTTPLPMAPIDVRLTRFKVMLLSN
jgi:hypothetical protein